MTTALLAVAGTLTAPTWSFGGITNANGRQCAQIDNSAIEAVMALVYSHVESNGSAPTAGTTYDYYLIRYDKVSSPTYASDNAGTADAGLTQANAQYLGSIKVTAAANTTWYGDFDTSPLGPLGIAWAILVMNNSAQSSNATGGNHLLEYSTQIINNV